MVPRIGGTAPYLAKSETSQKFKGVADMIFVPGVVIWGAFKDQNGKEV